MLFYCFRLVLLLVSVTRAGIKIINAEAQLQRFSSKIEQCDISVHCCTVRDCSPNPPEKRKSENNICDCQISHCVLGGRCWFRLNSIAAPISPVVAWIISSLNSQLGPWKRAAWFKRLWSSWFSCPALMQSAWYCTLTEVASLFRVQRPNPDSLSSFTLFIKIRLNCGVQSPLTALKETFLRHIFSSELVTFGNKSRKLTS